jgi:energy-coupling factor transporter ATP-binding protein EcfA2
VDQTGESVTEQSIGNVVLALADGDQSLSERAKLLILAALDGDDALRTELAPGSVGTAAAPAVAEDDPAQSPVGAYLTAVEVSGFRGVGDRATLTLMPGPGLIIVAGRNGSGKSSFAEALELTLTGNSFRWAERSVQWMSAWRNLHQPDPCSIRIRLAAEDSGPITVGVDWAPGADLTDHKVWTQRAGGKQEPGVGSLGWDTAMKLYRPILSYEELGRLLDGRPTDLYEAMERILGLGQVNDATRRLTAALKQLRAPDTEATSRKPHLRAALEGAQDPRADNALKQLRKHHPDLEVLAGIATGTEAPATDLAALRQLAALTVPSTDVVDTVVLALRNSVGQVAEQSGAALALAENTAALLRQALDLHHTHGTVPCPVCGQGMLDDAWRATAEERHTRAGVQVEELVTARAGLERAKTDARRLVSSVRPVITPANVDLGTMLAATNAYAAWTAVPAGDLALADHIERHHVLLAAAFDDLRIDADGALKLREDAWTPVAQELAAWLDLKLQAQACEATTSAVAAAAAWITRNAGVLRNQRLLPLADEARRIWARLRQESNVDLGSITLDGQSNRRRLSINATVDGSDTTALAVMSQGELHALALALFLPRATMPESPLRFVVLDDPVQAMDPAKIDGFVRVLSDLARDRQVVVFSHDDRLAEVVRRTTDNGQIVEVIRESGSRVSVRRVRTPAMRYLEDARALIRDENVPDSVIDKVLPGMCRLAVESAARERYYKNRLTAGADRTTVETTWSDVTSTTRRIALALFGDPDAADMNKWRGAQPWRRRVLRLATSGVHNGTPVAKAEVIFDLERTLTDLRGGR